MTSTDALLTAVGRWLPTARWFAGKGRPIESLTAADAFDLPGNLTLLLVDVRVESAVDRYAVPVDAATGTDAACTPAFAAWLLGLVGSQGTLDGSRGRLAGHAPDAAFPSGVGELEVTTLGHDASNTSFRAHGAGIDVVVKLLRRVRTGVQPEVEFGEFLATTAAGWNGTPRWLGWLEHAHDASAALATLHAFEPGCVAAWDVLLTQARASGIAGPQGGAILDLAGRIGRLTAEMHGALAARADVPDFAPAPTTLLDRRAEGAALVAHARHVCTTVSQAAGRFPDAVAARLRAVAAGSDRLAARLAAREAIDDAAPRIRVHGDYHLGQVLVTTDGRPVVIDFEGEPGRTLAERRAKATACKDVAGMCRSFDYLLRAAAGSGGPAWRAADLAACERRFIDGYVAVARGAPWWPADPRLAGELVGIHALDKALYELEYEITNRPDWVEVPLASVEAAVAAAAAAPAAGAT